MPNYKKLKELLKIVGYSQRQINKTLVELVNNRRKQLNLSDIIKDE